jgi:hypothetical protein
MNKTTTFVAAIALAASSVGLQADPTVPVQSDNSSPSQQGFVLKELPFRAGHPDHDQYGAPRLRFSDDAADQTSGNWSGYASVGATFTSVTGSWVVPAVTGTAREAAYTATWVGLDGYSDGTVEQCGTLQEWTGSKQSSYAWFEMYPNPMYEIEGATVEAGDTITATVSYVGTTTVVAGSGRRQTTETEQVFSLTMIDDNPTTGWKVTVGPSSGTESYTTVPTAARASAEWIMEAPTSGDILPLANFGTDLFSGCSASTSAGSGPIDFASWTPEPIVMEDPEDGEATPSGLTDTSATADGTSSFTVTYSTYNPAPVRGFGR